MALAPFRRLVRSRYAGWLLALVLWLPAAQWAGATHALLHLRAAMAGDTEQRPAHLPAPCEACVVAASLGGAAPGAECAPPAPTALPQGLAAQPPQAAAPLAFAAPYRSRAPPLPHA